MCTDAGCRWVCTPHTRCAGCCCFFHFASAAQTTVDSSHMLPATPLHHEATYCSEKWSSTWSCKSPVPQIWRMGYESRAVTVKTGPGQAYLDAWVSFLTNALSMFVKFQQLGTAMTRQHGSCGHCAYCGVVKQPSSVLNCRVA